MTVITYPVGSRASTRFSATCNGSPLPLWGRTVNTQFGTVLWPVDTPVPQSWATIASDETVTISVSLLSGPITSAIVYTNSASSSRIPVVVSAGVATFQLPFDTCCWLEANNDRARPLLLANRPVIATPSGPGVVTYNGTQAKASAGTTLVFPNGEHTIGQFFVVEPGASIFASGGAWIIGSLLFQGNAGNSRFYGHGGLSGEWGDKGPIRSLPFEQQTTYSLIRGEFLVNQNNYCEGVFLVDSPWYTSFYGVSVYERVTVIGPWWANTNGFFPGQKNPEATARISKCLCFVHDDIIDFGEYLGSHRAEDNLIGSVGSADFIVSYWPSIDTKLPHYADRNTLVCLGVAYENGGSLVQAWCDGGSPGGGNEPNEEHHVVSDVYFDGLRFEGPSIEVRPFDFRNRLFPWGPPAPGQAVGQIRNIRIKNVSFSVVPTVKSKLLGKDRLNTPHDFIFENVFYAGVRLTVANFTDYFEIDDNVYNIFVDGVPLLPSRTSSGTWFAANPASSPYSFQPLQSRLNDGRIYPGPDIWLPQNATLPTRGPYRHAIAPANWSAEDVQLASQMVGSSTMVATPTAMVALRVVAQGVSSMTAGLTVRQGLSSVMQAGSTMFANPTKTSSLGLSAAMTSSSSFQAALGSRVSLACVMAGGSSMAADLTPPGSIELGCVMQAGSTFSCSLGVLSAVSSLLFDPMKQRIFNTLQALCSSGPFHESQVNVKTGQMTVYTSKVVKPTSVDVREITKQYQPATRYRRAFNVAEIASWVFEVELRFASGIRVSCEVFEQTIADAGISVPPAKGIAASRSLLARLTDSKYDEPPAQNPSLGSVVLFTFEVVPETLRS